MYDIILSIRGGVMHKVVDGTRIVFLDDNNNEIMYIDYPTDECFWFFYNSEVITITENDELFPLLKSIIEQEYEFNSCSVMKNYKDNNKLVWYSDCYYDPDEEWSVKSVSYLTIEYIDGVFKLKCTKPLDEIINRKNKTHVIAFSPLGNGEYAKNVKTGLTLQDEFVLNVYKKLLTKEKVRELQMK